MAFHEKFARCMVMAGGGFRFGYYLGMHAAAVDRGQKPDILLGSCGGAIAAAIINRLPDDPSRRNYLSSAAMHRFFGGIAATRRAKIHQLVQGLSSRYMQHGHAPQIPDLFDDHLFELPEMPRLPEAVTTPDSTLAIIGAKMLFSRHETGLPRVGKKLFREVVFCDARSAALLNGMQAPCAHGQFRDSAIVPDISCNTTTALPDAVRISISDPYYFTCHPLPDGDYSGGLIDIFPIEIAQRLAHQVIMERKSKFNQTYALPAVRAVFGIDGNARWQQVNALPAEVWIDTQDARKALGKFCIGKKIYWLKNTLALNVPTSQSEFAAQMNAQWEFGYRRAQTVLAARQKQSEQNKTGAAS